MSAADFCLSILMEITKKTENDAKQLISLIITSLSRYSNISSRQKVLPLSKSVAFALIHMISDCRRLTTFVEQGMRWNVILSLHRVNMKRQFL